jgi:hypothetical protein
MNRSVFFLGGHDLEMLAIRAWLKTYAPGRWFDKGLSWGARASAYQGEITACLNAGDMPVLVELEYDLDLDPARVIVVDHRGARAGKDRPTSLHQIYELLNLPPTAWTRWHELVAANDRGYIPALVESGASLAEIIAIRAENRAAQGITTEQEAQAEAAARAAEVLAGGWLTLVRAPHARTSAITDRLDSALGGPGYRNLLVLCPGEIAFFGNGKLVVEFEQAFPGGWYGGALPERGFWGHRTEADEEKAVLDFLLRRLKAVRADGEKGNRQPKPQSSSERTSPYRHPSR